VSRSLFAFARLALVAGLVVAATLASSLAVPAAAASLTIVATTTQVQDYVARVGGDRITILPVLGPNEDPHTYLPTADDARNFSRANVVFANGLELEPWLEPLLNNVPSNTPVIKLGEESDIQLLLGTGAEDQTGDPHVWHDPTHAQKMVAQIRNTLSTSAHSAECPH
jgi:ABC-type Zn uptake system ZnuABC Zn-binding protein ZnuA